ncbi:hypothetical protein DFP72DRAFT_858375 [Ephemerocybe angulata]|uniref:Uncharacterized protein n=1 Tax=Ephemerocybe angulata TaxID=980116 RepID=A0A8H6HB64_9AGAR|nr:hypothetical protein DFP72DRAFT_858375 [Tulosesus angulatus]
MAVIPAPKAMGASWQRRSVDLPLYEPATRQAKAIPLQESLGRRENNDGRETSAFSVSLMIPKHPDGWSDRLFEARPAGPSFSLLYPEARRTSMTYGGSGGGVPDLTLFSQLGMMEGYVWCPKLGRRWMSRDLNVLRAWALNIVILLWKGLLTLQPDNVGRHKAGGTMTGRPTAHPPLFHGPSWCVNRRPKPNSVLSSVNLSRQWWRCGTIFPLVCEDGDIEVGDSAYRRARLDVAQEWRGNRLGGRERAVPRGWHVDGDVALSDWNRCGPTEVEGLFSGGSTLANLRGTCRPGGGYKQNTTASSRRLQGLREQSVGNWPRQGINHVGADGNDEARFMEVPVHRTRYENDKLERCLEVWTSVRAAPSHQYLKIITFTLVKITAVRESQCLSAAERCERLRDPSERLSGIAESRRRRGSQRYRTIREGAVVLGESALELQRPKVTSKRGGTRQDTVTVRGVSLRVVAQFLSRTLRYTSRFLLLRLHGDSGLRSTPSLHEQGIHDRRWHVLLRRWKRNWDASLCAASVGGGGGIRRVYPWRDSEDGQLKATSDGHDTPSCTRPEPGWEWPAADWQEGNYSIDLDWFGQGQRQNDIWLELARAKLLYLHPAPSSSTPPLASSTFRVGSTSYATN